MNGRATRGLTSLGSFSLGLLHLLSEEFYLLLFNSVGDSKGVDNNELNVDIYCAVWILR